MYILKGRLEYIHVVTNNQNEKIHMNILFNLGFVEIISLARIGVLLRGVFYGQSLSKY